MSRYPYHVITLDGREYLIHRYQVLGTSFIVHQVFERFTCLFLGTRPSHSTVRLFDGIKWGLVTSRRLPAHIEALPKWPHAEWATRADAAFEFQNATEQEAYSVLTRVFPECEDGERTMGSIYITMAKNPETRA